MLRIYNTLPRKIQEFIPIRQLVAGMYSCGPTVYDYQHIGHMRRYVGDDILKRVLKAQGFEIKHVMNITDVGHLVSDTDTGQDKMEKGAKKYGVSVWDVAKKFEEQFFASIDAINIERADEIMRATDYIKEQIALIEILEAKGYTYPIEKDGIYFDTSKFPSYFDLSGQNPGELKKGARVEFVAGKKNPSDFALWKFSPKDEKRQMEWESPWGIGFPGWHIECSAMSLKALTDFDFNSTMSNKKNYTIDIHTGGIDHIAIHHSNEIAQSEAATGKKFVNYWVHHNFLVVNGEKMSKSLGNFYTVQDVVEKGYDPLALRYLYLQTHYRQEMNFTWESLDASQTALEKLREYLVGTSAGTPNIVWIEKFMQPLTDDLNTAKALAVMWEMLKDEHVLGDEKKATLLEMDKILGLDVDKKSHTEVPEEIKLLVKEREVFRKQGDFTTSDELREKIKTLGWEIEDSKEDVKVRKIHG